MKKSICLLSLCLACGLSASLFALSYDNNEFQRKSRQYSDLAQQSYDEGDYDMSVEYARQAEDYAAQSEAFIARQLVRADTEKLLFSAHTRLSWARDQKAEKFFAAAFASATDAVAAGDAFFAAEDYESASSRAQAALDALAVVRKVIPLPATWRVELWTETRDCLWNIAANPAVYGDPLLWEELYKANKKSLKRPSNPNLLVPGSVITIPSVAGEYREGQYDPAVKYESFKSQTKK